MRFFQEFAPHEFRPNLIMIPSDIQQSILDKIRTDRRTYVQANGRTLIKIVDSIK